jgi:hypothetical protein
MSHPTCYCISIMKPVASKKTALPVQLTWSHLGVLYRATVWPDVAFETHVDGKWHPFAPDASSDVFAAAAVMLGRTEWTRYLDFVPVREREFFLRFRHTRLAALAVVVHCPELLAALEETPALTAYVANHVSLRGCTGASWSEIQAVFDRNGVFGLLEWLGLPASRQTLDTLARLDDPDVAKRLLEPLREALWNPAVTHLLRRSPTPVPETTVIRTCQALAA